MTACRQCGREIKWKEITKKDGSKINVPIEVDGSDHKERVGDVWQCKKVKTDEKQQKLPEAPPTAFHGTLLDIHTIAVATRKRFYPESDNWNEERKEKKEGHYEKIITELMKK